MRIMHIFRAPVGGLFRHVHDLALEQARAGHKVGLICALGGGEMAAERLAALAPRMALGITRIAMPRPPHPGDVEALAQVRTLLREKCPHIAHGHGAKGGLYARLSARGAGARAVYTPHGGSLHFSWRSPKGALFLLAERWQLARTDGMVFVCEFEREAFTRKVGCPRCPVRVVHNGLTEAEFAPLPLDDDAADVLFIGEMRRLKGVDVLIEALARLHAAGRPVRACLVGDGPERADFAALVEERGLASHVRMPGAMPASSAFRLGRVVVVPSRAESFPYVVLEAQAAGRPVIASRVGGIAEMLPEEALVPPEDAEALARKIAKVLDDEDALPRAAARIPALKERFSSQRMAAEITAFYESL